MESKALLLSLVIVFSGAKDDVEDDIVEGDIIEPVVETSAARETNGDLNGLVTTEGGLNGWKSRALDF